MKILHLLVTVIAIVACSKEPIVSKIQEGNRVSYLQKNDRTPSSEPNIYWEAEVAGGQRSFQVGSEEVRKTFNVTLNQVATWEEQEPYQSICQVPGEVEKEVIYNDYECNALSSGSNPLWNAFFQAKKEDKAKKLADAIKGVGEKSAEALVRGGYFRHKPDSWEEFKRELRNASESNAIKKSVYTSATTQYGTENLQNLGYNIAACKIVRKTGYLIIEGIVDVPCTKSRIITRKKIIQSLDRTAVVYVQGQILQSFERDTITFSAEGNGDMSVSGERYNRYELKRSVKGSTTTLTLTGVERNHVDLPYEALTTADLQPNGNKLTFSLIVDPKYIPAKDSADQLVIQYKVYSCKNGWGICAVFGRDEQAGETKFSVVKSSNTFIPIDINSKRRYWVEYSIQRRNSPFYNDKFLHMRETSSRTGN